MLKLVYDKKRKASAQATLERNLKEQLKRQGLCNIGFPGGNFNRVVYSNGDGDLWAAFKKLPAEAKPKVPRYANYFGIYSSSSASQTIVVEINVPTETNTREVRGFFAEDSDNGVLFLMHSGGVGGGRFGVGKSAFLVWSRAKLIDVTDEDGRAQQGIAVGRLDDPNLAERIFAFVRRVDSFKKAVAAGGLETPEFKRNVEEFDTYNKEFSGRKKGIKGGAFEYVTYHGDIVEQLFSERKRRLTEGEQILNNSLIDLFVKKAGKLTEVYEVKTGAGRQLLYTAIGQLMTHGTTGVDDVSKFLVIPGGEHIPEGFDPVLAALRINVWRFRIRENRGHRVVKLERP